MSSLPQKPALPPVLALLQLLASQALAHKGTGSRKLQISHLKLREQGVGLDLALNGVSSMVDGTYHVELVLTECDADESRFAINLGQGRLGKMLGSGIGLLPAAPINALLSKKLGDAVKLAGKELVVDHEELAEVLSQR